MEVSEKGLRAGLAITQGELGEPPPPGGIQVKRYGHLKEREREHEA